MTEARRQVLDPSLQAALFQGQSLLARLESFSEGEFPSEAIRIRDLFILLIQQAQRRLWAIHQAQPRDPSTQGYLPLTDAHVEHIVQIGGLIQGVHACLRYLEASKPPVTPPEIQTAISALIRRQVPRVLGCRPQEVVVLVRPQWEYSLKYVNLLLHLEKLIEFSVLDPDGELSTTDFRSFLSALWENHGPRGEDRCLPKHVAVISFAGLDGHDALLYPLLTHEVGHLIDFGYLRTLSGNPRLQPEALVITSEHVSPIFDAFYPPNPPSVALEPYRSQEINRLCDQLNDHLQVCMREITVDLLATRMLGLPYFCAVAEYLKSILRWPEGIVNELTGYPGMAYRLQNAFEELTGPEAGLVTLERLQAFLPNAAPGPARDAIQRGIDYLKEWSARITGVSRPTVGLTTIQESLHELVRERVEQALPELRKLVREVIPAGELPTISENIGDLITLLAERVPPLQPLLTQANLHQGPEDATFGDVLTAGWLYELALGEARAEALPSPERAHAEYHDTCQLLFKAIELNGARAAILELDEHALDPAPARPLATSATNAGAASGPFLVEALTRPRLRERLCLVPFYGLAPVNAATLDIRLGNWFRIARRTRSTSIDLTSKAELMKVRQEQQSEVYVPFRQFFTLHPGDFALAVSLEYLALPPDLVAFVEGKSSLGRGGLIVATATQVAPGFKGSIVLELFNSGTVPLKLRPGMSVAQLAFFITDRPLPPQWLYSGKFRCQVKP
jgi:dCTP deaminase